MRVNKLFDNASNVTGQLPVRKMVREFPSVTEIPNVISLSGSIIEADSHAFSGQIFTDCDRFQIEQ